MVLLNRKTLVGDCVVLTVTLHYITVSQAKLPIVVTGLLYRNLKESQGFKTANILHHSSPTV